MNATRRGFLKGAAGLGMGSTVGWTPACAPARVPSENLTPASHARWVSFQEVYSKGKHNAWPDLCRWRDRYYLTFPAHGEGHAETHGIAILSSPDLQKWELVLDQPPDYWRMDGKEVWPAQTVFFLPTERRLFLVFWSRAQGDAKAPRERIAQLRQRWLQLGGSEKSFQRWINHHEASHRTGVVFTEDGKTWSRPQPLLPPTWWLWRPHTFQGRHYMIGFRNHAQEWSISPELESMIPRADSIAPLDPRRGAGMELFQSASLFTSEDGLEWSRLSDIASNDDDEPDLTFGPGGRMLMVSRNGAAYKHALAYVSDPPYRDWRMIQLDQTIHQPSVLDWKGGWIVGGRYVDENTFEPNRFDPNSLQCRNGARLWSLDEESGKLTDLVTLPSWGDCGQPAMVPTPDGDLAVAYYSCSQTIDENLIVGGGPHPGKYSPSSIYLARVVI